MKIRIILIICITVILQFMMAVSSFAYFNRGTVSMEPGRSDVKLSAGQSVSVSVNIDPISEQQLPGCGMAECPQTCGNTGCLNEYGECTCAGTSYQTYYSSVKAVSGNSSVATASYSNGTLTINGVSAGTTSVTLTGSMRQYTDCTRTISVTVTGNDVIPANKAEAPAKAVLDKTDEPDADDVEVKKLEEDDSVIAVSDENDEAGVDKDSDIISTEKGVYEIVELTSETDVKAHLQTAIDNSRFITFRKQSGENVLYSWTFDGRKLKSAEDIDLGLEISDKVPDVFSSFVKGANGVFLDFNHDGELPASAEIYVNVADVFSDEDSLKLLRCDAGSGDTEIIEDGVKVENGYVTFSIDHCSSYILTGDMGPEMNIGAVIAVIVVILAAVVFCVFLAMRRRKRV